MESDYRGKPYDEFRESEKAKPDYPQAGPPHDKTTYMGRIRDKIDTADNEFAKSSRDYRSTMSEMEDEVKKWYDLVNKTISMVKDENFDIVTLREYLIDMRRNIKGG